MKSVLTEAMYNLYLQGYSLEQIGNQFNVSRQSVYDRFKRRKLQLRSKKNKPFIIVDNLKFTINRDGYYECTTIDRLMLYNYNWEKLNGKIPKGYELHHKDLNKLNNDVSNLQLVTPKEHTEIHSKLKNGSGMNKKVKCLETGEVFDSIIQVAKKHNQHASNVSRYYIDGKRKLNGFTYEKID
jgi:predicted DNA-binding protein YlxM (UPF0122 family)